VVYAKCQRSEQGARGMGVDFVILLGWDEAVTNIIAAGMTATVEEFSRNGIC
jgi:hypothetical protein